MPRLEPERLLDDLDPEQREAVLATSGPVAILAGAGTGKTRVISRRTAYAIGDRGRAAGPGAGRHVHRQGRGRDGGAAAIPRAAGRDGADVPRARAEPAAPLLAVAPRRRTAPAAARLQDPDPRPARPPAARPLPVHAGEGPRGRDRVGEVAPDQSARVRARGRARGSGPRAADPRRPLRPGLRELRARQDPPGPHRLRRPPRRDRRACSRTTPTPPRPSAPASAGSASTSTRTRARSSNGCSSCGWATATDLCVVGDVDQTIYTFTGASSGYLTTFAERHPGARVLDLTRNYRSTPQVLELANRLIAADGRSKRLTASRGDGPEPSITKYASAEAESDAMVAAMRGLIRDGIAPAEIAVLVRMNAQIEPIEAAMTKAGLPYQVRGVRFYDRPEVKGAISSIRRPGLDASGKALVNEIRRRWVDEVGFEEDGASASDGREALERQSSLETLLDIVSTVALADPACRCRGCHRGAGPARRARTRERRRRHQPPDLPPGEGPRVGRGLPADARGGLAADPAGAR